MAPATAGLLAAPASQKRLKILVCLRAEFLARRGAISLLFVSFFRFSALDTFTTVVLCLGSAFRAAVQGDSEQELVLLVELVAYSSAAITHFVGGFFYCFDNIFFNLYS